MASHVLRRLGNRPHWLLLGRMGVTFAFSMFISNTAIDLLDAADICSIRWDVLLLIAGGLSLGVAVTDSGLADWLVQQLPLDRVGAFGLALVLTYASAAMCLPISTPPNAIVYGTGQLDARDLLQGGLIVAVLAPLLATGWCWLVFSS